MATTDLTEEISQERIDAVAELEKRELELRERPAFDTPRLPTNLTALDDPKIMQLLARFTKYQDFIAGQLGLIEIDYSAAKARLEVTKARYMVDSWTGATDDRVTISKAKSTLDPKVQKAEDALRQLDAKRKVFSILENTMARDAAVVSREITRRTGSSGPMGRNDRLNP
jgi:hypothetical protein